ncbi:MAG: hypothetical protein K0U16_07765 [Gammaproteobacteria bacterium]|nr:hypothetical protein [Gammaproteobacteria bacterium]
MATANTWWWVGIGTGIAALGTAGGVLIWRSKRAPVELPPPDLDQPPPYLPPFPPPPPPTEPDEFDIVIPAIPFEIREEICRQWKIGTYRPDWRPELFDVLMNQIDIQIERRDNTWTDDAERKRKAFLIARGALRSLCPQIPRPKNQAEAAQLSQRHFYWKELWNRIYPAAYNKIHDQLYTGFEPV